MTLASLCLKSFIWISCKEEDCVCKQQEEIKCFRFGYICHIKTIQDNVEVYEMGRDKIKKIGVYYKGKS